MMMSNQHVQTLSRPLLAGSAGHPVKRLLAAIVTWQQRYDLRQHLLEMDAHLLDDIGFSRAEARQEAAKPFWRD
jgi:uncharacterized protein YjiS (DUF1127 family)